MAANFESVEQAIKDLKISKLIEQRQAPTLHRNAISTRDFVAAPATPTTADVIAGGSLLTSTTYKIKVTCINDNGETTAPTAASQATSADAGNAHCIDVIITRVAGAKKYGVYLSVDADPLYKEVVDDAGSGTTQTNRITATGTGVVAPTVNTAWSEPSLSAGIDCVGYEGVDFDCKLTLTGTTPVIELTPIHYNSFDAQWYAGESIFFGAPSYQYTIYRQKPRIRVLAKGALVFLQIRTLTGTTPTFTLSAWASKF